MIIGTAGHIDHGKSALVTALTGRPMDRLAEEKRRGITIDLGFAPLRFEGLPPVGMVDVPGHEDFVRTMVAGASGIDLVLLVIDAVQGPQPQTWEHLAIVEQLRVPRGIPVITKADLADPEWLELVTTEVVGRLASSPVAFEAAAIVSAVTGQGLPELRDRLRTLVAVTVAKHQADQFRMPLDRAFSLAGVGTVVTGTPWSGALRIGDQVIILPRGESARVRSLEAYGEVIAAAGPGARTAVGLAGTDKGAIHRGDTLVLSGENWRTTSALDVQVQWLSETVPARRRLRVRLHLGTAEVMARLHPRGEITAGGTGLARLSLEEPVVARGNDRFVLRGYSPVVTIGGGRVLDPLPPRRATWPEGLASEEPVEQVGALVRRRPAGIPSQDLALLSGVPAQLARQVAEQNTDTSFTGGRYVARSLTAQLRQNAVKLVRQFHERMPAERGLSLETLRKSLRGAAEVTDAVLDGLVRRDELVLAHGLVAMPGFAPTLGSSEAVLERALLVLAAAGLAPPTVAELEEQLGVAGLLGMLRYAAQQGRVVAVEKDRFFSDIALKQFRITITELAANKSVTPAQVRDRLGLSRKYLIPLLEWSDRTGITRRVGDARVLV